MRWFISECDPAHEYLTAVHAFLICIAFGLCISVFLPFSLHRHISGISPGRFSDTNAKASLFSSVFPQNIFSPAKRPHLKIFFISTLIDFEWADFFVLVTRDASMTCCAPEGWLFDPFFPDHDLWTPCWSWDLPLPWIFSPGSRRKQALVTQWSLQPWRDPLLQSHGRLQGLMEPCELYFLTNFCFPEAHDHFTGHACIILKYGAGLQDCFVKHLNQISQKSPNIMIECQVENQDPYRFVYEATLKMIC